MINKPPIFIGGAGRSGTTLLRVILDSHSQIACGPELKVSTTIAAMWYNFQTKFKSVLNEYYLNENDINKIFAEMILSLLEKFRQKENKPRIAEKSPNNVMIFSHLHKIFPESPLIHVIRDGRDVITSLLTMDWVDPNGKPVPYTRDIKLAAQYWHDTVRTGINFKNYSESNSKYYYQLKYEEMVTSPEDTLKSLFEFINESWEEQVLSFHEKNRNLANESSASQVNKKLYSSSMARWKKDLSEEQKEIIKPIIGNLLIELQYESDLNW